MKQISFFNLFSALLFFSLLLTGFQTSAYAGGSVTFNEWQAIGPSGGDVRVIAIDPKDKNRLYAGTLDGQIYYSTDGGGSWALLVNFNRPQLTIDNLVIDPRDSKIIYATGHRFKIPGGFFKTTDGGITWKESKDLRNEAIHSFYQSEKNPDFLTVGSVGKFFVSTDAGNNWKEVKAETATAPPSHLFYNSLAVDPQNTDVIYLGTSHRLYKSLDGGKNWRLLKEGMIDDSDVMAIDIDPQDPKHIIATACSGIYESFDGAEKWRKIPGIPSQSRRTRAIARNPSNKDLIYIGTTEGFWMSENGGKSWTMTTSRQVEINTIAVHRDAPQRIFIGTNNYGVMVSEDGGKTFSMSNAGFSSRQTNKIVQDIVQPNRLYATTRNTAIGGGFFFISNDGGKTWSPSMKNMPRELSTDSILQDKTDPNLIWLGTNQGLYRSLDRGASWTKVLPPKVPAPVKKTVPKRPATGAKKTGTPVVSRPVSTASATPAQPVLPGCPSARVNALTISINQLSYTNDGKNGILAATVCGLYRTYDVTKGWERLSYPIGKDIVTRTILAAPEQPNTIWAGTASSGLMVSRDNGVSFRQVEDIMLTAPISAIEIDKNRPENLYVGTKQTFYLSRDGGLTWKRRGGNLPIGDYVAILINPSNPDEIFVGSSLETSAGVFQSTDAGENWKRIDPKDQNLASRRVWALMFDPQDKKRLLVGSHSAGIYMVGTSTPSNVKETTRPRMATP